MGAPQFYMKGSDIGGAVYVYINMAGQWESVEKVRLNGTKDSMFGLAVKNIGDINKDSYEGNSAAFVLFICLLYVFFYRLQSHK